jgi:predicted esterase
LTIHLCSGIYEFCILMMNKTLLSARVFRILSIVVFLNSACFAQSEKISPSIEKQSFIYASKDTSQLGLDVYTLKAADSNSRKPCIIFVFGGAFVTGSRDDTIYHHYFNNLVENNYNVVAISYRLGMRGVQHVSKFNIAPLRNAVNMAVADLYSATSWVIKNSGRFGIDTTKIILSGSSSGAITVLTADFQRRNNYPAADILPVGFEYAGIISFAGAILDFDGSLKYAVSPSPYLMFHGTADKIVPYNKIRFFNKGFYGSAWIAKTFKEKNHPYYFYSEEGMGHEIAVYPMFDKIPVILDFLDKYIIQAKPYQTDLMFKDPNAKPMMLLSSEELFKKLQSTPPKPVESSK